MNGWCLAAAARGDPVQSSPSPVFPLAVGPSFTTQRAQRAEIGTVFVEHLWTPWRFDYVSGADQPDGCLFCWAVSGGPEADPERLVLHRGELNFVMVNKYPYNNGHLMVAPFVHVADLEGAEAGQLEEMMLLTSACEGILRAAYHPDGFNIGMNLGQAAGAGVAGHHHLHIVPRWAGDTNFLTATNETRVVPETPERTYERLLSGFEALKH